METFYNFGHWIRHRFGETADLKLCTSSNRVNPECKKIQSRILFHKIIEMYIIDTQEKPDPDDDIFLHAAATTLKNSCVTWSTIVVQNVFDFFSNRAHSLLLCCLIDILNTANAALHIYSLIFFICSCLPCYCHFAPFCQTYHFETAYKSCSLYICRSSIRMRTCSSKRILTSN